MKKGLSVLLIAAALFGFYGGAVSINDVLACKDYWEKEGEKSTADMNKLEDGLNQLKDNEQAYLDGLETLADGEKTLADGEAQYAQGLADYEAAPAKLRAAEAAISQGEKDLAKGYNTLQDGKAMLKKLKAGIAELNDADEGYETWRHGNEVVHGRGIKKAEEQGLYGVANDPYGKVTGMGSMFSAGSLSSSKISDALDKTLTKAVYVCNVSAGEKGGVKLPGMIQVYIAEVAKAYATNPEFVAGVTKKVCDEMGWDPENLTPEQQTAIATAVQEQAKEKAKNTVESDLGTLTATKSNVKGILAKLVKAGLDGEEGADGALSKAISGITAYQTLGQLAAGKTKMQNKLLPLLKKAKSNKDMVKVIESKGMKVSKLLTLLGGNDDQFEEGMDYVMKIAPVMQAKLAQAVNKGQKDYNAGKAKLAAGKAQYNQGLADYAAAPAKLEDAEKQLADGRQQLADGKKKLAEYEDGEKQVRDGLATLMGTEADLDLESILDRRNGDDEFDDANGHLQLDEGLDAVKTGREYQADDGVLITKEITARAIGTVGCLAAAALAILAGVLSLLKKYKAAAVSAVLTAIAGGVGIAQGMSAGEYFSNIAGSTVGNTPFIAAGVLAAVAAVFAIVNFTAKKES